MDRVQLDADEATAQLLRRDQRAARAREGIEDYVAGLGEGLQERCEDADRLLCRMQAIAG